MPRWKFSRFHLAPLVLAISVGTNFLQARSISTLLDKSGQASRKGKSVIGVRLPPLELLDFSGARSTLSYSAATKHKNEGGLESFSAISPPRRLA